MTLSGHAPTTGMEFPCTISIKVFVRAADNLESLLREIIVATIAEHDLLEINSRLSRKGRYQSFSCKIRASDRKALDAVFTGLSQHPDVLIVI